MPDLTTYTWRRIFTEDDSPIGSRYVHTMVGIGDRIFMFGGGTTFPSLANVSNDCWMYANETWTQVFPDDVPPARNRCAMAWDGSRVLMVGGFDSGSGPLQDTWSYDPDLNEWTELFSDSFSYTTAKIFTLAWDSDNLRFLLTATGYEGIQVNHTWQFESGVWTQLTPADDPDNGVGMARISEGFAYGLGKALLFGGRQYGDFDSVVWVGEGDTWEFDTNWVQVGTTTAPGGITELRPNGRWGGVLSFDNDANFLWFGGETPSVGVIGRLFTQDTWTFTGGDWVELAQDTHPTKRGSYAMAWLEDESIYVLHGGYAENASPDNGLQGDTWVFEGPPIEPPPPPTPVPEYHTLSRRVNYQGQWDVGTAYAVGDAVTHNRETFLCIQANTGEEPDDT